MKLKYPDNPRILTNAEMAEMRGLMAYTLKSRNYSNKTIAKEVGVSYQSVIKHFNVENHEITSISIKKGLQKRKESAQRDSIRIQLNNIQKALIQTRQKQLQDTPSFAEEKGESKILEFKNNNKKRRHPRVLRIKIG